MKLDLLQSLDSLKLKNESGNTFVWDPCRKKWVAFTPEEMIRQLYMEYLIRQHSIPIHKIQVEKQIKVGLKLKRFDVLVYDRALKPFMVIECKSPDHPLDEKTASQVVRYNLEIQAPYQVIVNGYEQLIFMKNVNQWNAIESFPSYG